MAGPSGVDAPAQAAPSMFDDTSRVISALSQGDHDRAASIVVQMGDVEFGELRRLAHVLDVMSAREAVARQGVPEDWTRDDRSEPGADG